MVEVTDRMIAAAHEFQSACIDAGFDYGKLTFESADWSINFKQYLRIFGVDMFNKTHTWEE